MKPLMDRLILGLVLLVLSPFVVVKMIVFLAYDHTCYNYCYKTFKRWAGFLRHGLAGVRQYWLIPMQYESRRSLWRYVIILEFLELLNSPKNKEITNEELSNKNLKILVIRLAHIGDVIHTTPLLKSIKYRFPCVSMDVLAGPWSADFVDSYGYGDTVWQYAPYVTMYQQGEHRNVFSLWAELCLFLKLRSRKYDICFSVEAHHLLDVVMMNAIKPKIWIGLKVGNPFYHHCCNVREVPFVADEYEATWANNMLKYIDIEPVKSEIEFPDTLPSEKWFDDFLSTHELKKKDRIVVLGIGAGWVAKQWPVKKFAELAEWLISTYNLEIIVLGGKKEVPLGKKMELLMSGRIINVVGRTALSEAAMILKHAVLYIGNDNGLSHIAVTQRTPTLVLFGPTCPEKWAPRGPDHRYIKTSGACRENCDTWHPMAACQNDYHCISVIDVDEVKTVASEMLVTIS